MFGRFRYVVSSFILMLVRIAELPVLESSPIAHDADDIQKLIRLERVIRNILVVGRCETTNALHHSLQ